MGEKGLVNWLKLCNVKGLGPQKMLKLFNFYKDIDEIVNATSEELLRTTIFKEKMIEDWIQLKEASSENFEKVIEDCENNNITIIPLFSDKYPKQLRLKPSPPLNLFLQGNVDLLYEKKVAIVGSRESDEKAKQWTFEKAKEIAEKGYVVISGGARGIDYQAHAGALSVSGKTICVFGSGLFKLFPEAHSDLFEKIKKEGLLISEHLPNFAGDRIALLQRNRITSGLSNAIILATSSSTGGTATQLKIAHKQRIPIFCPKKELNFSPYEGIEKYKDEYGITEVDEMNLIMNEMDDN